MSSHIPICLSIGCPMFHADPKTGYGCQRYTIASQCHLKATDPSLTDNQYALYAPVGGAADLENLRAKNEDFFASDRIWESHRKMQALIEEADRVGF